MNKLIAAAVVVLAVGACGGKKGKTTPDNDTTGPTLGGPHHDAADMSGTMVPPEKQDEIQRLLSRKRDNVSRCLSIAVDNKELPKNSHGKVTLGFTISPAGHADDIKIINASLDSKSLHDCIIKKVQEIQFPEIPSAYPTSYAFAFEAS